jgi:hypothetical protein
MNVDVEDSPPMTGRREKGCQCRFRQRKRGKDVQWIEQTENVSERQYVQNDECKPRRENLQIAEHDANRRSRKGRKQKRQKSECHHAMFKKRREPVRAS